MKTIPSFSVGDKVAYSVQFLKSIGESALSPLCHARGEITELKKYGSSLKIASIRWENDSFQEFPGKVNCSNLAKVGSNDRFCAC